MKIKSVLVVIVSVVLLAGCATVDGYKQVVESWDGSKARELIASWGVPTRDYEIDGVRFIEYDDRRTINYAGTPPSYQTVCDGYGYCTTQQVGGTSPQTVHKRCVTTFTIDGYGVIRSWSFRGNDCKQ